MADLATVVRLGDADGLLRLLEALTEAERRALAPETLALRRTHEMVAGTDSRGPEVDEASRLALYGTASLAELRAAGRMLVLPPERLIEVLRLRPPSFLGPWADWFLEHHWHWDPVRALVVEGCIPTPSSPWYVLRMLGRRQSSPSRLLADDPALLDDEVWRLFQVEGSGELSLAAYDKYVPDEDSWQAALLGAARDPTLRARFLDASLAALARDMGAFRAGWFSRFHEALRPSLDERASRAGSYALLLRSPVRATVSFAVSALEHIARSGRLPREGAIDRLGPALADGAASTARSALRVLGRALAADASASTVVTRSALEALRHEMPEVQAAALGLLESVAPPDDPGVVALLAELAGGVAESLRARCGALLRHWVDASGSDVDVSPRAVASGEAGISAPATAARAPDGSGPSAPPRPAERRTADPLAPARAIAPITGLDELIEVLAGLLETGGPADDIERALDGVSRLGRGADAARFERHSAPLASRATTLLRRRWPHADPRLDLACLVLRWARGEPAAALPHRGLGAFLAARVARIAERAAAGMSRLLLAAPTHLGGWIDPAVLVDRIAAWPAGEPPDELDAAAAILRLRVASGQTPPPALRGLRGELADAVRHALGDVVAIGPTAALWVAAARARAPGSDDVVVEARHPGLGPDAGRAARMRLVSGARRAVPGNLALGLEPPPPSAPQLDLPSVLLLDDRGWHDYEPRRDEAQRRWEATVWPGWRESWSAVGALAIGRNLDWWTAQWGNRVYLEPLLEPWTALGPRACQLLGIALGAKEAGERGLAADAVIAAIGDGRLDAGSLSSGLDGAVQLGLARPRRWASALGDVASVSPWHAEVIQEAASRSLAVLGQAPSGESLPLLRLVHELVHRTRQPLTEDAAAAISSVRGSGQARRLADQVLAISGRSMSGEARQPAPR